MTRSESDEEGRKGHSRQREQHRGLKLWHMRSYRQFSVTETPGL